MRKGKILDKYRALSKFTSKSTINFFRNKEKWPLWVAGWGKELSAALAQVDCLFPPIKEICVEI